MFVPCVFVCDKINLLSLAELASVECQQDAVPFLCLYGFPIFSCLEQQVILPTREECQRITTTTCQVEFNLAVRIGFSDLLPDCNELPSNSNDNQGNHEASDLL